MLDDNTWKILKTEAQTMCDTVAGSNCDVLVVIYDCDNIDTLTEGSSLGLDFLTLYPDVISRFKDFCNTKRKQKDADLQDYDGTNNMDSMDTEMGLLRQAENISDNRQVEDRQGEANSDDADEFDDDGNDDDDTSHHPTTRSTSASVIKPQYLSHETSSRSEHKCHVNGRMRRSKRTARKTVDSEGKADSSSTLSNSTTLIDDQNDETDRVEGCKKSKEQKKVVPTSQTKCTVCHKVFKNKFGLLAHSRVHGKVEESQVAPQVAPQAASNHKGSFQCEECDESFTSKYLRKVHMVTHGPKQFFCHKCDSSFHFQKEFKEHQKTHEDNKCPVCFREFKRKDGLRDHMVIHDGSQYKKCDLCGKAYWNRNSFRLHIQSHNKEKNFICQVCGKAFVTKVHLTSHMVGHGEKKFQCRYCDASFCKIYSWKTHENALHTHEQTFMCDVCGTEFRQKSSLRAHRLIHLGISKSKYKCRYCPMIFKTMTPMKTHVKNQHQELDLAHERPLCKQCDKCFKVFAHNKHFHDHMDMHAGIKRYKCKVCAKLFSNASNLREHMKIHNDTTNKHTCEVCHTRLRNAKQLNLHMLQHKGSSGIMRQGGSTEMLQLKGSSRIMQQGGSTEMLQHKGSSGIMQQGGTTEMLQHKGSSGIMQQGGTTEMLQHKESPQIIQHERSIAMLQHKSPPIMQQERTADMLQHKGPSLIMQHEGSAHMLQNRESPHMLQYDRPAVIMQHKESSHMFQQEGPAGMLQHRGSSGVMQHEGMRVSSGMMQHEGSAGMRGPSGMMQHTDSSEMLQQVVSSGMLQFGGSSGIMQDRGPSVIYSNNQF